MTSDWYRTFFAGLALELWRRAIPPGQTRAEADFLERALEVRPGARLLDVPCGNGRLALVLAERGYTVTGVDLSAEFLAEGQAAARRAGLTIDLREGEMSALEALLAPEERGASDGAFCFGNSFGYHDRAGTAAFLAGLAAALRPGARLAIDTGMAAESFLPELNDRRWWEVDGMLLLVEHDYDVAEGRLDTDYTFIAGRRRETRRACHWIYTVGEAVHLLAGAGFATEALWADLERTPYEPGAPRLLLLARRLGTP
jgi:SAM-dependent methyltransferase